MVRDLGALYNVFELVKHNELLLLKDATESRKHRQRDKYTNHILKEEKWTIYDMNQ
jgi:hypothetical protein